MKRRFCLRNGLITAREVNEARRPHTCSSPCAFEEKKKEKKKTRNPAAPKTHCEIHRSPATATTSRRRATKHVSRVSPYSPASTDPGFVEIGLVQLSQSVKNTNVAHTQTDGQTDYNNGTLCAPRYEEAFLRYRLKTTSVASLPRPCLIMIYDMKAYRYRKKHTRYGYTNTYTIYALLYDVI